MKTAWHSLLLTLQFFTVVPIHKEFPLTKKSITGMFVFLPWIGAAMGLLGMCSMYALQTYSNSSPLLLAFVLVALFALFTGGLHLDGWIDMSDAFFSYRNVEKRLEILDDPRVGAFGVLSILFLVLGKLVIIHELFLQELMPVWAIVFIPFLTRCGMTFYFMSMKCSKEKGLAYFFKTHIVPKILTVCTFLSLCIAIGIAIFAGGQLAIPFVLVLVLVIGLIVFRQFTLKNFGGVSGDLLGAFIEGMEVLLWLTLLLCV
ncbi:MAG: adenosylcobinamide-GDP ribazoletransferase [Lysinibacillus sp.]